ncbi:hypothetical protein [Buchananella hordeovulneris]|uniref:hypothetical protein n=1 Tax=Buchananella hordeovulneris TaxID=52770 RepID=UPI0011612ACB|nr:hypothetical protein [Buchananella hordeovulneris]MDO5081617.1 hypothetical protein [Buchananella hordeovulneris]
MPDFAVDSEQLAGMAEKLEWVGQQVGAVSPPGGGVAARLGGWQLLGAYLAADSNARQRAEAVEWWCGAAGQGVRRVATSTTAAEEQLAASFAYDEHKF